MTLLTITLALFGLSSSAQARSFNVKGRLFFEDGDPVAATSSSFASLNNKFKTPGRSIKVTVEATDSSSWSGHTDSQGNFSIPVVVANNVSMKLIYEIDNFALHLYADTDCINERLLANGGVFSSGSSGDVQLGTLVANLVYSTVEVGECGGDSTKIEVAFAGAMNINNVILSTWDDASKNRDPGESDSIGQVIVEYCDEDWNHYFTDLSLTCSRADNTVIKNGFDYGYMDATIVHEYGHHLQYEIGAWDAHSGSHQSCVETDDSIWNDEEFAWSEGFPKYLGRYIVSIHPEMYRTSTNSLENECGTAGSGTKWKTNEFNRWISVEGHAAAILWDLQDGLGSGADAWDQIDGKSIKGHQTLMQIFDKELDFLIDAPTLVDFYDAWVSRKGKYDPYAGQMVLDGIFNRVGVVPAETVSMTPLVKMAPTGFIETSPSLPSEQETKKAPGGNNDGVCDSGEFCSPNMTSSYLAKNATLDLDVYWSYAGAWGDVGALKNPISLRLGVSNLGAMSLATPDVSGSSNQANSASYDATAINFTGGGSNWLSIRQTSGASAKGTMSATQLTELHLGLDTKKLVALKQGVHDAKATIKYTINPIGGGAVTQSRLVRMHITVADNAADDIDSDGLSSHDEVTKLSSKYKCIDPTKFDSDGDGLSDGIEINTYKTNPCKADTDGDGTSDGTEASYTCLDPTKPDSKDPDGDGVTTEDELKPVPGSITHGSNPCKADTDGDGVNDGKDNCPITANADQADDNGDGIGDACERAYDLEQWLTQFMTPRPPETVVDCRGGCGPPPPWFRQFPWDEDELEILIANGVLPSPRMFSENELEIGELPKIMAFGSQAGGRLQLEVNVLQYGRSVREGVDAGSNLTLLDENGVEVWRIENISEFSGVVTTLRPGSAYQLIVTSAAGARIRVSHRIVPGDE